jgi:hypothetical protein
VVASTDAPEPDPEAGLEPEPAAGLDAAEPDVDPVDPAELVDELLQAATSNAAAANPATPNILPCI